MLRTTASSDRAIDAGDAQTDRRRNDACTLERLFHDRMKDLLERELSGALQVRAFFARFSDDTLVVVCEQADGLGAADVDAKDRHYRYITVHDRPVWRRSRPARRCAIGRHPRHRWRTDRRHPTGAGCDGCDGSRCGAMGAVHLRGHVVLPGFIDVHVHGLEGLDTLDGGDAIAAIAERLPKFGVTAFCPTTVACAPHALREVLQSVAALRADSSRACPP